jgi:hypothetical protein
VKWTDEDWKMTLMASEMLREDAENALAGAIERAEYAEALLSMRDARAEPISERERAQLGELREAFVRRFGKQPDAAPSARRKTHANREAGK